MKLKQALGVAALACITTTAHAQSAGSIYVTTGWFHLAPQSSSEPLRETNVNGTPVNITLPNTGATAGDGDTIGFTAGYFFTDHIATQFDIGIPPQFDLKGSGAFQQYGKIGSAKQWSPTLLLKYYFNEAQSKFRPYLGIGDAATEQSSSLLGVADIAAAVVNNGPLNPQFLKLKLLLGGTSPSYSSVTVQAIALPQDASE